MCKLKKYHNTINIELNYQEITFFGFIIVNLFNYLDGVLTYIGLYIIPKGELYETNIYALNLFNSIGFFNIFIIKLCYILFFSIILIYFINKHFFINIKGSIIFNNIFFIWFIMLIVSILMIVFSNALYLLKYYL